MVTGWVLEVTTGAGGVGVPTAAKEKVLPLACATLAASGNRRSPSTRLIYIRSWAADGLVKSGSPST